MKCLEAFSKTEEAAFPIYKPDEGLFTLLDRLLEQSVPIHRIILMKNRVCGVLEEELVQPFHIGYQVSGDDAGPLGPHIRRGL